MEISIECFFLPGAGPLYASLKFVKQTYLGMPKLLM